tara:strand:- start:30 stop:347 length:318 start_codon:yes stop_codon:yes gene_type:complete
MKKLNILNLLIIVLFFYSCSTLKQGFVNPKKNSSDEFLVEKKSPLVMPPDYGELPVPKTVVDETISDDNKIKNLVITEDIEKKTNKNPDDLNKNFEENLLEKIKN